MSGSAMVERLGFFSSHPRFATARLLLWFGIAALPLAGGALIIMAMLARDPDGAMQFVADHGRALLVYGLAAAGFAIGFGLTSGLAACAARSKMLVADRGTPPVGLLMAIGAMLVLGSLPWLIPVAFGLEPRTRALIALLGVLPLMLVVTIVSMAPTEDSDGNPVARNYKVWTIVFPAAVLSLLVLTRMEAVSSLIASWSWVNEIIRQCCRAAPSWTGEFNIEGDRDGRVRGWIVTAISTVILAPVFCLSLLLIGWLRRTVVGLSKERRKRARPTAEQRAARRGLLGEGRTKGPVRRNHVGLTGVKRTATDPVAPAATIAEQEGGDAEAPPGWVAALRETIDPLGEHGDWIARRGSRGETAPAYAGEESFSEFFAGHQPSTDQVDAFKAIHREHERELDDREAKPFSTSDMLIEGPPGSGRTAVAAAIATHSVVLRGHVVLVLVPNRSKVPSMIRRIRRSAESAGVGWYLNIGDLTPEGSRAWTEPAPTSQPEAPARTTVPRSFDELRQAYADASKREALERSRVAPGSTPDILVGTLADLEEVFFTGATDHDRLRAVLLRIGMMVVDDVDLFDMRQRIHLPSVLNKVRFLLASEGLRAQTVLFTPTLHDVAREHACGRLLSEPAMHRRLRPFRLPDEAREPWQVLLTATAPGAQGVSRLLERCAESCVGNGLSVVVYSPRMSSSQRRELADALEKTGSGSAQVVADLDELDDREDTDLAAIFYAATNGMDASMAIRARSGSSDLVLFTLLPKGSPPLDEERKDTLLVLPASASRALFVSHFRSVSRFLRRLQPIDRDAWSRLGLPALGSLHIADEPEAAESAASEDRGRSIVLDPPDSVAILGSQLDPWPWAVLSREGTSGTGADQVPPAAPVDINGLLDTRRSFRVADGARVLFPIQWDAGLNGTEGASERRLAEWRNEVDEGHIGFDDLAYASRLLLMRHESQFVPQRIDTRPGTDAGRIQISARRWLERSQGSGQATLLSMRIADLQISSAFVPRLRLQSARPFVRVVELAFDPNRAPDQQEDNGPKRRSGDQIADRQFATFCLNGIADDEGNLTPIQPECAIRFESSSFLVLFGFNDVDLQPANLERALWGQWGAAHEPERTLEPELGLACTFAFRRLAPGVERFARIIGFRLGAESDAKLGLLIVEPFTTRNSALGIVDAVTRDRAMFAEFLALAKAALNDASSLLRRGHTAIGASHGQNRVHINGDRARVLASKLEAYSRTW
jgi:hypothetical protein